MLVVLVFVWKEFLVSENIQEIVAVIRFFHGTVHLSCRQGLVPFYDKMVDFYPFALVDIYVNYVAACRRAVLAWHYIYFGVVEAFVPVISQYVFFSLVYDVGRKLRPFLHTYAFFQVLLVAFLYAVEIYLRNSRSLVEVQVKPDFVTAHGYDFDFHVRKKPLLPETAYHVAYVVGGNSYLRPLFQAGISDKYEILVCVFP